MELTIVRTQRADSQNCPCSKPAGLLRDTGLGVFMSDAGIQTFLTKYDEVSGKHEAIETTVNNQASTRLTKLHTRCLEKRVGECNQALKEALSAICDAESEAPSDEALRVVHTTLDMAQKLTEIALGVSTRLCQNQHEEARLRYSMQRPLLRYYGGKFRNADRIIRHFPRRAE